MSENLSILQCRDGDLEWLEAGASHGRSVDDPVVRAAVEETLSQRQHAVSFAVPGADLRLLHVPVSSEERRHLDSALPFMLEEQVSEDIEDLHFPRRELSDGYLSAAVVNRERMGAWEDLLGNLANRVPWIPEALLLPWDEGAWTLVLDGSTAILRWGQCLGTSIEREMLEPVLSSLMVKEAPARFIVYGIDENADLEYIPASLHESLEWRRGGLGQALLLSDGARGNLNLRQGAYVPRLPYEQWWSGWRNVAALLLAAVILHGLAGWFDYRRLERQNLALRQEIESIYREVNPRGAVVDPEKQLRRQLASLRGGGSDITFSGLLAPLGAAVAERDDMLLASLNYSQRSGELRINLVASDFVEVEGLRQSLVEAGLEASLESSSRNGERVRARLRIGEGS